MLPFRLLSIFDMKIDSDEVEMKLVYFAHKLLFRHPPPAGEVRGKRPLDGVRGKRPLD